LLPFCRPPAVVPLAHLYAILALTVTTCLHTYASQIPLACASYDTLKLEAAAVAERRHFLVYVTSALVKMIMSRTRCMSYYFAKTIGFVKTKEKLRRQ